MFRIFGRISGVRDIHTIYIYLTLTKYYEILEENTRERIRGLRPASEIKIFVINLEAAAELFLHLKVFVCRILVTVDLHIRNVSFLGRGRLIDLDEALRGNGEMPVITLRCLLTCQLVCCYSALLFFSSMHAFGSDIKVLYTITA